MTDCNLFSCVHAHTKTRTLLCAWLPGSYDKKWETQVVIKNGFSVFNFLNQAKQKNNELWTSVKSVGRCLGCISVKCSVVCSRQEPEWRRLCGSWRRELTGEQTPGPDVSHTNRMLPTQASCDMGNYLKIHIGSQMLKVYQDCHIAWLLIKTCFTWSYILSSNIHI